MGDRPPKVFTAISPCLSSTNILIILKTSLDSCSSPAFNSWWNILSMPLISLKMDLSSMTCAILLINLKSKILDSTEGISFIICIKSCNIYLDGIPEFFPLLLALFTLDLSSVASNAFLETILCVIATFKYFSSNKIISIHFKQSELAAALILSYLHKRYSLPLRFTLPSLPFALLLDRPSLPLLFLPLLLPLFFFHFIHALFFENTHKPFCSLYQVQKQRLTVTIYRFDGELCSARLLRLFHRLV